MIRRIAFVIGSIASALLAIEVSPPTDYVVERFTPSPTPRASVALWPATFLRPRPSTERQPGATWSPLWRPPFFSDFGRGK